MHILLLSESCNPEEPSVPLQGYEYYRSLRERAQVTLVTAGRNQAPLYRSGHAEDDIIYVPESKRSTEYFRYIVAPSLRAGVNWALINLLSYPLYAEFNAGAYRSMHRQVRAGVFDIVHAYTPLTPRYPYKLAAACEQTPFILGPLNGGLAYPPAFRRVGLREGSYLHLLRKAPFLIPGYVRTYRRARRILAGSQHMMLTLRQMFPQYSSKINLFYDNGVPDSFVNQPKASLSDPLRLLYVGRLVPLKGVDMIIDALAELPANLRDHVSLTVVGDGGERGALEAQSQRLGLQSLVRFVGSVPHSVVHQYYRDADVFVFPSIREMGGAVVLEALAMGLPCIVTDYGGIGEYVTDGTGFRIAPTSRAAMITAMAQHFTALMNGECDYASMSTQAIERARTFTWSAKADQLVVLYREVLDLQEKVQTYAGM